MPTSTGAAGQTADGSREPRCSTRGLTGRNWSPSFGHFLKCGLGAHRGRSRSRGRCLDEGVRRELGARRHRGHRRSQRISESDLRAALSRLGCVWSHLNLGRRPHEMVSRRLVTEWSQKFWQRVVFGVTGRHGATSKMAADLRIRGLANTTRHGPARTHDRSVGGSIPAWPTTVTPVVIGRYRARGAAR